MKKKIVILGSTGSIGKSTLAIIEKQPSLFEVVGLSCYQNIKILQQQVIKFKPKFICLGQERLGKNFEKEQQKGLRLFFGNKGLNQMLASSRLDLVVCAISGYEGIYSMLEAINLKIPVAIANKEPLVIAGKIVSNAAKKNKVPIYPIDSEHNAVFQCLKGHKVQDIEQIILTASGGPFWLTPKKQFSKMTKKQALNHPKWKMGKKNTVDSATMMNKALEVIEAKWLFGIELNKIQVLVHPQSTIHAIVQFKDGSSLAQLAEPDMKVAISYCLGQSSRLISGAAQLDLAKLQTCTFFKIDKNKFSAVEYMKKCASLGEGLPAALNGANEWLVQAFLKDKISFYEIIQGLDLWMKEIQEIMKKKNYPLFLKKTTNLAAALNANQWGIELAKNIKFK